MIDSEQIDFFFFLWCAHQVTHADLHKVAVEISNYYILDSKRRERLAEEKLCKFKNATFLREQARA